MIIGVCTLELHLAGCRSLKDKRMRLTRFKRRLCSRFNVAVAEVDHQDLWQRSVLGVVSVSTSQSRLDALFQKVVNDVERLSPGTLVRFETEYL